MKNCSGKMILDDEEILLYNFFSFIFSPLKISPLSFPLFFLQLRQLVEKQLLLKTSTMRACVPPGEAKELCLVNCVPIYTLTIPKTKRLYYADKLSAQDALSSGEKQKKNAWPEKKFYLK